MIFMLVLVAVVATTLLGRVAMDWRASASTNVVWNRMGCPSKILDLVASMPQSYEVGEGRCARVRGAVLLGMCE